MPAPNVGDIIDGYEYTGGNPNDQSSWRRSAYGPGANTAPNGDVIVRGPRGGITRIPPANTGSMSGAPDTVGQRQDYQTGNTQLAHDRQSLASVGPVMESLDRFQALNRQPGTILGGGGGPTGSWLQQIPGVRAGYNNVVNPHLDEMSGIAGRIQARDVPSGQGQVSNFERTLFASGVPDVNHTGQVNDSFITAVRGRRDQEADRLAFMERYLREHGSLNGATELWTSYVQQNPYTTTNQQGRIEPNAQRTPPRTALQNPQTSGTLAAPAIAALTAGITAQAQNPMARALANHPQQRPSQGGYRIIAVE